MSQLSTVDQQFGSEDTTIPVDTGRIRCICSSTEDDGFTIQCERCLVWQHAYCVKITHASIPEHYLCDQCIKRKRPKLSKRIPISKKRLRKLDSEDSVSNKKKKHVKSRIISRYVYPIFKEAKERWNQSTRFRQQQETVGPLLYDHGPFVTMDATTLLTKGVLMDTPVMNGGLYATKAIPALRYLMEITGDIVLKSEFKFDPINDFVILGTPLSHIMFYPTLDLCIDTRQFGNKARYIRRSCHPNAELRNVVLSRDDKTVHLGLFARHLIDKSEEVTISWSWQRGHITWKENMSWHHQHKLKQGNTEEGGHQVIDEEEERRRKATIKTMLDRFEKEFGECACVNKKRCLIEQLKRQIAPPKEKPVHRLPAVNILPVLKPGRRKSSVILLKPKIEPAKDNPSNSNSRQLVISPTSSTTTKSKMGLEEAVDIDVTSNSPTLGVKEDSDDELLDVEGDIDIGDDLPVVDNTKSHSSDEEDNADLSSLSSLSSLSVFEESGNNLSDDDESRSRARRKKSSRHGKHARSHHKHTKQTSSSSTAPTEKQSPVIPTVLPRKKLWMRDYLNKHVTDQTKPPDVLKTSLTEQKETLYTNNEPSSSSTQGAGEDLDSKIEQKKEEDLVEAEIKIDTPPHDKEEAVEPQTIKDESMDIDIQETEVDIDEGELSDASTIQLDETEIQHVYQHQATEQSEPTIAKEDNMELNETPDQHLISNTETAVISDTIVKVAQDAEE